MYLPFQFMMDRLRTETGLACALPAGEFRGAKFALWVLHINSRKKYAIP